jgi:Golgi SNAP receptor complex protein 1
LNDDIMSGYDALHRQCRTLESLFDSKLTAYARLASSIGRGGDDTEASGVQARWSEVEQEVGDLLEKVRRLPNWERNGV